MLPYECPARRSSRAPSMRITSRKRSDRRGSAEVAACHGQENAGDVGGLVRGQEQNCRRLLVRCSKALHQAAKESLIHDLLVQDLLLFARLVSGDAARLRLRRAA